MALRTIMLAANYMGSRVADENYILRQHTRLRAASVQEMVRFNVHHVYHMDRESFICRCMDDYYYR